MIHCKIRGLWSTFIAKIDMVHISHDNCLVYCCCVQHWMLHMKLKSLIMELVGKGDAD